MKDKHEHTIKEGIKILKIDNPDFVHNGAFIRVIYCTKPKCGFIESKPLEYTD